MTTAYTWTGRGRGRHRRADHQVDVALTAGATITTTLTDRATGGPAQGCVQPVDVDAALVDTGFRQWCTEAGGNTLRIGPLAPGTYQLIADPELDTLGLQWVGATGGTGSREAARLITVASGAVTAGPAIVFDRAGAIRGKYTDAVTGAPIGGACVSVITPPATPSAATAAAGPPRRTTLHADRDRAVYLAGRLREVVLPVALDGQRGQPARGEHGHGRRGQERDGQPEGAPRRRHDGGTTSATAPAPRSWPT